MFCKLVEKLKYMLHIRKVGNGSGGTCPASLPLGRVWKKDLNLKDFKGSLDYMRSNLKKERSLRFGSGIKCGLRS